MWKIKRFFCVLLTLAVLLSLAACGGSNQPTIEQYEWTLDTVQSDNDGGEVIACAVDYLDSYPDAAEVSFSCAASKGTLEMTDHASGQIYSGVYAEGSANQDSIFYTVQLGDSEGNAASALTRYTDGGSAPTLVLSIDGYTLYFTGQ